MKTLLPVFLFLCFSSYGQNASNETSLQKMQIRLDSLQQKHNDRLEMKLRSSIQRLKNENDSLKLLAQMLNTELLISQGKLKSQEAKQSEEASTQEKNPSKHTIVREAKNMNHYFVIIDSERSKLAISKKQTQLSKRFPNHDLAIIQNESKTWYHLLVNKGYDRATIGFAVQAYRNEGVKDAWWIKSEGPNTDNSQNQ